MHYKGMRRRLWPVEITARSKLFVRTVRVARPAAHGGEENLPSQFLRCHESEHQHHYDVHLPPRNCQTNPDSSPLPAIYISRHRPCLWRRDSLVFGHRLTRRSSLHARKRRVSGMKSFAFRLRDIGCLFASVAFLSFFIW